jgi:hypothetical protein
MDHKGAYKIHLGQTSFEGLFGIHLTFQRNKLIDAFLKTWEEMEDEWIKAKVCDKNTLIDQQFFCDFPMFPIVVRWIHLQPLKKVLHKLSIKLLYWAYMSIMKNEMWSRWRNHALSKFFLCYTPHISKNVSLH